jgi:hypothetical protein
MTFDRDNASGAEEEIPEPAPSYDKMQKSHPTENEDT